MPVESYHSSTPCSVFHRLGCFATKFTPPPSFASALRLRSFLAGKQVFMHCPEQKLHYPDQKMDSLSFHPMLIEGKPLKHWIDNFYGYGAWEAKIWFVGYEDGGVDLPQEVAQRLDYFYDQPSKSLCDIRKLYRQVAFNAGGPRAGLFKNLFDYRFGSDAMLHGAWKNLIGFVHGYRNKKLPDLLEYQRNSFATTSEALIQLYPLPSPHNHAWYYAWLDLPQLGFLKSRPLYEEYVYQSRMQSILHNIRVYKPEVVVMYGMNNINMHKQSVQEFFPAVKFKMVKAVKRQIPQHHRTDLDGTTLLITTQIPALRHNRIETGFDWQEFGRSIKKGN